MARWVTHRTDATAKPLIKYAESIGLTYVALGGAIDGLLSWGSRIAAIEWKSKGGTLTPTQAKIVATGFPLRSDGAWHTARSFQDQGSVTIRINGIDRMCRIVAERSQGRIISGQKGYKLTKFATVEEIDHAERWLLSQGRKMIDRAREIRIARNRGAAA